MKFIAKNKQQQTFQGDMGLPCLENCLYILAENNIPFGTGDEILIADARFVRCGQSWREFEVTTASLITPEPTQVTTASVVTPEPVQVTTASVVTPEPAPIATASVVTHEPAPVATASVEPVQKPVKKADWRDEVFAAQPHLREALEARLKREEVASEEENTKSVPQKTVGSAQEYNQESSKVSRRRSRRRSSQSYQGTGQMGTSAEVSPEMEKVVTYDELNETTFVRLREKVAATTTATATAPIKELSAEEQIDASMQRLRLRQLAKEGKAAG